MRTLTFIFTLLISSTLFAVKDRTKRDPEAAVRLIQTVNFHQPIARVLSKIEYKRKNHQISSIDYALISHSNLIVLEFLDLTNFETYTKEDRYPTKTQFCEVYQLNDEDLKLKYHKLIGETVFLNDHYFKRKQFKQQIIDIVLVHDRHQEKPYVAAVTDIDPENHIYYAWASSKSHDNQQFGEKLTKHYNYGDEITESYHDLMDLYKNSDYYVDFDTEEAGIDDYTRIDVAEFNSKNGHFFILENKSIGLCEFVNENHLVLYQKVKGSYKFVASGNIDQQMIDVIDIDQDGFPEIITGAFTSSSIFQFKDRQMNLLKTASWSYEGCPC